MKKVFPFIILWLTFLLFVFWRVFVQYSIDSLTVLEIISAGLSIFLLIKNKLPAERFILLSILLMILSMVSYLGYSQNAGILIYGLKAGIPTLLGSLAFFSVMEKYGELAFVCRDKKLSPLFSVLIAMGVGIILSVINSFMANTSPQFEFSFNKLLVCLNPAIFEEIACRAVFMVFCVFVCRDSKMNVFQLFTMYFMMCIPHSVAHGYDFGSTIILSLLFGLPLAILQRKRDLLSAMICHGLIDAVRFTVFGF